MQHIVLHYKLVHNFGISTLAYANIKLVKTTDNSEIKFPKEALVGTDAEKEFLATGKNIYVGDAEAIKPLWDTPTVQADFDRCAMLPVAKVADTLLHIAQQPPQLLLEDITLMPAAGAL
jgi:hypothetical protein